MRIGVYQFSVTGNIKSNREKMGQAISKAYGEGIDLLVFPECSLTGYPPRDVDNSSAIDFEECEAAYTLFQKLCNTYKINALVGSITRMDNEYYNSAILFSPDEPKLVYNKRALWGWDRDNFSVGNEKGVIQIGDWKIGIRICYEIRFPEFFRELYKEQTDLNIVLFYDVSDSDDAARYEMIKAHILTRAVENVSYVLTVNSITPFQTAPTVLCDRSGRVLCEAERNREQMLIYELEKKETDFGETGRKKITDWLLSYL